MRTVEPSRQAIPNPILHQPPRQSSRHRNQGNAALSARGGRALDLLDLRIQVMHAQVELSLMPQAPGMSDRALLVGRSPEIGRVLRMLVGQGGFAESAALRPARRPLPAYTVQSCRSKAVPAHHGTATREPKVGGISRVSAHHCTAAARPGEHRVSGVSAHHNSNAGVPIEHRTA
jgi:hypothetical protein